MTYKSLLLGSAALLAASFGASANEPVVITADAEPMAAEHVQICSAYSEDGGFYFIPGTETCLRVGGYVRFDIGVGSLGLDDSTYTNTRASVQLDARSETELGLLRGFMHLNFDHGSTMIDIGDIDGDGVNDFAKGVENLFDIEHAYIELGGLRIGKTDSLFTTLPGYAGGVINDDLVAYGPFGTHQMSYTYDSGNGLAVAIGLETEISAPATPFDAYNSDAPNVVGGAAYAGEWGGVSAVGAYDAAWGEFAAKARVDVKASDKVSLFVMGGWKSGDLVDVDGDGVAETIPNYYGPWGGAWAVWTGASATVSDKATLNAQVSYDADRNFAAVANVAYTLVPDLTVTPEIAYTDNLDTADDDAFGGYLRFERSF